MKLHRNENYFKWGLTAFLVFVAGALFWIVFSNLKGFYELILDFFDIISPILFGCLFAYLMNPVMMRTQRLLEKLLKKTKLSDGKQLVLAKTGGVIASLIVLLFAFYALIALIVPNIVSCLEDLLQASKLEGYYNRVNAWVNDVFAGSRFEPWFHKLLDGVLQFLTDWLKTIDLSKLLSGVTSSVYSVVMFVSNMLIGVVAAVYILLYQKKLCAQAKKITVAVFNTKHADRLFEIARRTNRIFSGYVIGKIIDAIFVGVVTYFALLIMGMPFAPLIAVIVGVTNIIPFFGPFLGAIPSALLLLIEQPIDALYFIIFILVLQMIDGNIIENRILGEKLGISDLWVLVAILVFGGIFGFGGMLLGVPVFAVLYTLIVDGVNGRLRRKRYPIETELYYSLQCVEDLPITPLPSASFVSVEPAYDMHAADEDDEDLDE
ncbi:MAG: AI-2E family transporter [Faecousia sp.]